MSILTSAAFLVSAVTSVWQRVVGMANALIVRVFASVDISKLLEDEGAAGTGGALKPLNDKVKELGGGAYAITKNAVIYIAAIALLCVAGGMAFHAHNAGKRDEDKSAVGWVVLACVLAFAGVSILIFAQTIGSSLLATE